MKSVETNTKPKGSDAARSFFGKKDGGGSFFQPPKTGDQDPIVQRQPDASDLVGGTGNKTKCDAESIGTASNAGSGVTFANNSSLLNGDAKLEIAKFATSWKANGSNNNVTVDGYSSTSGQGSEEQRQAYNLKLSCDRSLAVKNEMISQGVTSSFIQSIAHGETDFFGDVPENRRVQFKEIVKNVPPTPANDPVFTISGSPTVNVTPSGKDLTRSTAQVIFKNGDFDIDATVNVQTTKATDADDWEVGIVQNVAAPVSHACYSIPKDSNSQTDKQHAGETFVDAFKSPAFVLPDRESNNTRFMNDSFRSGKDLKSIHQGNVFFSVPLHAEDHPSTRAKGSVSALQSTEAGDSKASVSRTVRFGFMMTNVIARQLSTGRIIPLFNVEWEMFSRVDYIFPGGGLPPEMRNPVNIFQLIKKGLFVPGDFPPSVDGKTINELQQSNRQQSWEKRCPDV